MPPRPEPQRGLGEAIRRLRTDRRVSQEDLAERARLDLSWIAHLESGRRNPTYGTLRRIAAGLDVRVAVLVTLAEELEPDGDEAPRPKPGS